MSGQKLPIILNCIAAIFGAGGQYFYKRGSALVHENPFNFQIILGVLMFSAVMGLFVFAYKLGGKISIVYPFYATTFIWGTFIGIFFEKESVKPTYFVGLGLLLAGLTVIALQIEDV